MASWNEAADNGVGGFVRVVDTVGSRPSAAVYTPFYAYKLKSAGTVDLNGISRFQYEVTDYTIFSAAASINFSAGDIAGHPGWYFTVSAFLTPASAFAPGSVPPPSALIANAVRVARAGTYRTTAGTLDALMFPPASFSWAPNTKWWLTVVPVAVLNFASSPSIANDVPIGFVDSDSRAVSFWTNRTPSAPVVTTPLLQTTTFSGQDIDFTFSVSGPDTVASFPGDVRPMDFADVAGLQIQYRPKPTTAVPNPPWIDMSIKNTIGSGMQRGWFIKHSATEPANDGAKVFWEKSTMKIRCGGDVSSVPASSGYLPSGNWQVRMRTFDFGHPFPSTISPVVFPLNDPTGSFTPATYPAENTSPWSTPVNISVSEQVPPPIPITPTNSRAVIEGEPIDLTWQYRNTHVPPYAQAEWRIQIQPIGGFINEYSDLGSSPHVDVSDFQPFFTGTEYQWRVMVRDTNGEWSTYSEWAHFWIVPAAGSGGVRPVPGETIDGATLGSGTHRVEVYRRGGKRLAGELTGVSYVDWNRVRDDISTAQIRLVDWDIDCGNLLAKLQTWAYEIVIWRNNGFSEERVWEGPITLLTYEVDRVTIDAKDVMAYAYRRIIKQEMNDSKDGAPVTARASQILQNAFAPDDPNVLAYLQVLSHEEDAMQYRSTPAYSRTAFEEVDDMAANAGLDYTTVGRSILVWGTKYRIGTLPEFRDADFGAPPIVSEYGMSMANRYVVSDGNGIWGEATRLDVSGNDEDYGLVEMLSSTWASDAEDETGTYTEAGKATVAASFAASTERSIADRYPPPVVVRVPDNTTLNPDAVISIQYLVPGVVIPLRSTGTLRKVAANQKLDQVKVVEEENTERITVTMSPFANELLEEEG